MLQVCGGEHTTHVQVGAAVQSRQPAVALPLSQGSAGGNRLGVIKITKLDSREAFLTFSLSS